MAAGSTASIEARCVNDSVYSVYTPTGGGKEYNDNANTCLEEDHIYTGRVCDVVTGNGRRVHVYTRYSLDNPSILTPTTAACGILYQVSDNNGTSQYTTCDTNMSGAHISCKYWVANQWY